MIPVLACPVLNRPDLLQRMISSVDFPVDTLLIVNNGNLDLSGLHYPGVIQSFHIHDGGQNYGVAGSWNLAQDFAFHQLKEDAVLIVGNDIQWAPGDLQRMWQTVRDFPEADFVFGNHSYSNFLVKRSGFEKVGWFDETFYPAYLEDGSHWRTIQLVGAKAIHSAGLRATHEGSATINSDPELKARNSVTHQSNWEYYSRKWGCPMWSSGQETFTTPFNEGGPVNEWKLTGDRLKLPHFRAHS